MLSRNLIYKANCKPLPVIFLIIFVLAMNIFKNVFFALPFNFNKNPFGKDFKSNVAILKNEKKNELDRKFIEESFKNTCCGKGFSDLNEWQKTCRSLFSLDYIAWSDATEFMDVNDENSEGKLFYGKWTSSSFEGEVYCRRKISSDEVKNER